MDEMKPVNTYPTQKNTILINSKNICLLLCCLGLGIIADILFYEKPLGVSYPIFMIVFYCLFLYNTWGNINYQSTFGLFLSLPVLALSLTYALFSNPFFMVLNFLGIPLLVVIQTILLTKNNQYEWFSYTFILDILTIAVAKVLLNIIKPLEVVVKLLKEKTNLGKNPTVAKVLVGLLLSLPLLLVIIGLLSSADDVFNHYLGYIPELLQSIRVDQFIAHAFIVCIIWFISFSYLWSLIYPDIKPSASTNRPQSIQTGTIDPVIIVTVLIAINIVYVLFTLIQFTYLFGGLNDALPAGINHSEYARRGFFELVFVTLINLTILLMSVNLTKKTGKSMDTTVKVLNSILIACTLVMLFSAHSRMSLYEFEYGYTYLRILTHAFMAFLFVILLFTLAKVWYEKVPLLKSYIIITILSYLIVNYMNVDAIIAKNNMNRYEKKGYIDAYYLTQLSTNATPYMVKLLDNKEETVRFEIKKHLKSQLEALEDKNNWQSFNLADYRAKVVLREHAGKLK